MATLKKKNEKKCGGEKGGRKQNNGTEITGALRHGKVNESYFGVFHSEKNSLYFYS